VIRVFCCTAGNVTPGECRSLKEGLSLSIEIPTALATLPADAGAETEAHEQNREFIARAAAVLFATGSVIFACMIAVLTQLR
jgi:hypothetical protein